MMNKKALDNRNVLEEQTIISPVELVRKLPASSEAQQTVWSARQSIKKILSREDKRLLVITGPCSIHDVEAAKEYAARLARLRAELGDTLCIVMRIYFEKPRTTVGWKGLINDPRMDDSFHLEEGLYKARALLIWLAEQGIPVATEALDPISPQYLADLFSWAAIGARTTESQTHREMASGLSMPVGFKNGTDGGMTVAINALHSVSKQHSFLGINHQGQVAIIKTRGNVCGHVILRGGGGKANYDRVHVQTIEDALRKAEVPVNIMIDCSHDNSGKNYENQPGVLQDTVSQIRDGNQSIIGVMLESHLHAGNQAIPKDLAQLRYGVSVTDACMDWETTEKILRQATDDLKPILPQRSGS